MPSSYVRINNVYSPFKVDVTWLEFVAGNIDETAWKRSWLPVACAFLHKVFWKRSVNKSYKVYPRKGETWALYKNWNIKWSADPDKNREYEYEFVLVLSDYSSESGILVVHLPTKYNGMASFQIPSNEMLRFSHRVPSFRTNGKEREDVPEGYFELDPCSLPNGLEEMSETVDGNIYGSLTEKHPMPKKRKNPDPESTLDGSSPGGNKSSRMSNGCYNKNPDEERRAAEASDRPLDKGKATTTSVSDREKNAAAQAKEMSSDGVHTVPRNVDEDIPFRPCSLKIFEMPGTQFCNFDEGRSCEKFKAGQ
ncbi:hypothetical protein MKW98_016306, partial [Papaver atlanticum]